jgi:hypothetical protein
MADAVGQECAVDAQELRDVGDGVLGQTCASGGENHIAGSCGQAQVAGQRHRAVGPRRSTRLRPAAAGGVGHRDRPGAPPPRARRPRRRAAGDLGGLTYETAIRDHIRVDVLVARAAALREADSALAEVERVLRLDAAGASGACSNCHALHSRGATYCWQCGEPLIAQVSSRAIASHP